MKQALEYLEISYGHLIAASIASCNCDVKSGAIDAHKESCRYRHISTGMLAMEAVMKWMREMK